MALIKGVVSSDLRDGDWLGEARELLGSVNATMGAEELQRFYGLDIQAYRGSSPNIQELLDNEEELELESLRNGDGDNSMNTSADSPDQVLVLGENVESMADIGLDEIEEESIPDLTPGTPSTDPDTGSLNLSVEIEEENHQESERKVQLSPNGALVITRTYSPLERPKMEPELTLISPFGDIKIARTTSSVKLDHCGELSPTMVREFSPNLEIVGQDGELGGDGDMELNRNDLDLSVRLALLEHEVGTRLAHVLDQDKTEILTRDAAVQVGLPFVCGDGDCNISSSPQAPGYGDLGECDPDDMYTFREVFNPMDLRASSPKSSKLDKPTRGVDNVGGMAVVDFEDGVVVKKVVVGDGDIGEKFEFGTSPRAGYGESVGAGNTMEMQAAVLGVTGQDDAGF